MKIKNFLVLTLGILFSTNLISAATAKTGKQIADEVYGPLPLNAFKSHIIPNLLNAIIPNSPCASSTDVTDKDQGFFLGRTHNTNQLFAIDFANTLFKADNKGQTADKTAITFITKIETVLKIQFIETHLKDLDTMDLNGITNDSLQILKDIKQSWNDKNMTKLVEELNKLKFFEDNSGIGFIKVDSDLVKEAATNPDESLLNKLFATGVDMFGVSGLTPQLLLEVIHFNSLDLTDKSAVNKIENLGQALGLNGGTAEKETSSVAETLLKTMQAYVIDILKIKFFDGKGYGETDCQIHLFYNDVQAKKKYYSETDYINDTQPKPMPGSPVNQNPTQPPQSALKSIDDKIIIDYLKNDTVSTSLKKTIDQTIDALEKKTTKTSAEQDQLAALKVFQNTVIQNPNIDQTQIMNYLKNSENLNAVKTDLKARITTIKKNANATDAEKAELKILEEMFNKTEELVGYLDNFKNGTTANKLLSSGIPVVTGFMGAFTAYFMFKNQKPQPGEINDSGTFDIQQTTAGNV